MKISDLGHIRGQKPEWQDRPDRPRISTDRWGRDHWNLFSYVHSRVAGNDGLIDWRHVGVSSGNWPMLWMARDENADPGRYTSTGDAAELYGLRLKRIDDQPVTLMGVCEVDALMDMVDAGLVTVQMPPADKDNRHFLKPNGVPLKDDRHPSPQFMTGLGEWMLMPWAKFELTDHGWRVAQAWTEHKGSEGATYSNFEMPA